MVEPEIAENTVPATTATTASRPGTCRISRSTPSITFMARPVWNSTSPIRMNSGIGVSEKFDHRDDAVAHELLRGPASPPRKSHAPTELMAMNENATGMPMNSSTVEPPSSSSAATCQDIAAVPVSGRRDGVVARRPLGHAPGGACGRRTRPPAAGRRPASARSSHHSGMTSVLIEIEPAAIARDRHAHAVPDEAEAAEEADARRRPIPAASRCAAAARAARCRCGCAGPCRSRPGAAAA